MEEELKKFANWLWDMNRLRINSQIPGIRNADEMVDTYLKSVRNNETTEQATEINHML